MSKPVIAVAGATGAQGGSVVKYLLEDGGFAVRGLTRKVDSPSAKALADKGVEVVAVNFNDPASIRSAFKGAHGVYGVTNFWEAGEEGEITQGKAIVDAAKAEGVKHFVWSTLDSSSIGVPHWESKARVDEYLKASGVPRTSLYTAFYLENIGTAIPLLKEASGQLHWQPFLVADAPHAVFSVTDVGAWATAAFKDPNTWIGKDLRVASEFITPREIHKILEEVLGQSIKYNGLSLEAFEAARDAPTTFKEMWLNEKWFIENGPASGVRDVELSKKLHPKLKTFRDVATENKDLYLAKAKPFQG